MTVPSGSGRARGLTAGRLWEIVAPQKRRLAVGLAMLLCYSACRLAQPWLVMVAIDDHLAGGSLDGFTALVATFAAVAVLEVACRRVQLVVIERAGQAALLALRRRVFGHLQRLPASFYDRTPLGRLVGRVTTDIEALQELFASGVVTVLGDLVFLLAVAGILAGLSVRLCGVTMAMVPVLLVATVWIRGNVRRSYNAMRSELSRLNACLHEQVSGVAVVQSFAQEDASAAELGAINRGVRDSQLRSVRWESLLSAVTEMLSSFTTALILWWGSGLVGAGGGGLTLGVLFAFVDYMQRFFVPLNDLSLKLTVVQNATVAGERIFALLDEEAEADDRPAAGPWPAAGQIEFDRVTFGYDAANPVLRDVSFRVEPGEKVALVGATGAGKTTVLSLLGRLYDVGSGAVRVDGRDVREVERRSLRRRVGVVQQDVFLFRGTILDNVRAGQPELDEAAAIAVCEQLGVGEIVRRFPAGYHEPVAERGANLSAGERQLVAFARMLCVAPAILALDEATANVDSRTETLLQRAVTRLMAGRTALVVAHRLATVRDADRILVFAAGRIVESGTHAELHARGGIYRGLCDGASGGLLDG